MALTRVSVSFFKETERIQTMKVLKNPHTNKLFVACDNGKNYRCQQDLDPVAEVEFLIEDEDFTNACLINQGRGGAEEILSL